jgi:hypothetical protein
MPSIATRYSSVIVYNSITNDLNDEKFDINQSFTFLEYLNYTKSLDKKLVDFTDYKKYLETWNSVTSQSYTDYNSQVREQFINFLKTITLNYTNSEEKRFLSNINFNNSADLEIAAPFYTAKIKQILLYFAEKRDTYKIDLELSKNKGTIQGIQSYLKTYILETIFGNDNPTFSNLTTPLSTLGTQIQIEVEEGYDNFNDYFDLDPFKAPSFYNAQDQRSEYFSSNTNVTDKNIFLNYDQAIIDLINSEQVVSSALQTLVFNIDTPDLNLLQSYDFIDYTTRTRDNIKLVLNAELIRKFTGTDFYYLSTNSVGEVLSGSLFTATSPYSNLLNIYSPSTITVASTATVYDRDVGLFFKPSFRNIIQLQTPFTHYFKDKLKNDYIYIFPDPDSYGNVTGVSKVDHETPLNFNLQGDKIQKNISSNNALGNTQVTDGDFTFESYQSQEQKKQGDNIISTLYNAGVISQYISDVYGNAIVGFKSKNTGYINNFVNNLNVNIAQFGLSATTNTLYLSSIKQLLVGTLANTQSQLSTAINNSNTSSIFNTRNAAGVFYIQNLATNTFYPLSTQFSDVISKYIDQTNELNTNLVSVEVYNNTYVFTTSSFVIVDKVNYKNENFYKSSNLPLIFTHAVDNEVSNSFLVDNTLYFLKYYLDTTSPNQNDNGRPFNIEMYSYDVDNNTHTSYTSGTSATFIYDTNTKLHVYNVKLTYNKKLDIFNVAANLKDDNKNFFPHIIQCRLKGNQLYVISDKLYLPTNTNVTINFYDYHNVNALLYNSLVTTPTIDQNNGTITF